MPIIRGYDNVVHALLSGKYTLGHPYPIGQELLSKTSIEMISPFLGFTEEAADDLEITPVQTTVPILVHEGREAILLVEYDTSDKGKIPVWVFEILYPHKSDEMLMGYMHILNANGIKVVHQGRPDSVLLMSTLTVMSSRVKKALTKASSWKIKSEPITWSTYLSLATSDKGSQIISESLMHYACTQHPESLLMPEYWINRNYEDAYGADDIPLTRCLLNNPDFRFMAHYCDTQLIGLSLLAIPNKDEWHWINTYVARSGLASEIRRDFNLMYCLIGHLIEDASTKGVSKFNLGIRTFDYKEDFTKDVQWYKGLEYNESL